MQLPGVTYELVLAFEGAAAKRAVKAWLTARGRTDFVEGVIDGVGVQVATEDPGQAFADEASDATPLSLFDYDEAALRAIAAALAAERPGVEAVVNALDTASWSEAWAPDVTAGAALETRRFVVCTDEDLRPQDDKTRILLAGGGAFGQGDHATTEACLETLEALPAGRSFLDVGTGTGILAIAAARMGFTTLVGTDIDDDVLDEARLNARLNGVEVELHNAAEPPDDGRRYDVVAANILVPVLHQLMPRLAQRLAPQGRMLLAGFIGKEVPPLLATCADAGLELAERRDVRGWACLLLVRAAR